MKSRWLRLSLLVGLIFLGSYAVLHWQAEPKGMEVGLDLQSALSDPGSDFAEVTPGREFSFPKDHGEHTDFRTEWWYLTGNLSDASGRNFGYQLTFFRSGLPKLTGEGSRSFWRPDDVMMAHFAVSDLAEQKFHPWERLSRRALGLADISQTAEGLKVWLEDWTLERNAGGQWALHAEATKVDGTPLALDLTLAEMKPPVLQGEGGYSRKGPDPKYASYYVSIPRLKTQGTLNIGSDSHTVAGSSWFDHEWSSAALAPGLVGWDWFSLQLEDGREVMLYQLRYADGRVESESSGAVIAEDGTPTTLAASDFVITVDEHHRSHRGVDYPSAWTLEIPSQNLRLKVLPRMADQEMAGGLPYWEGAVTIASEPREGESPIKGFGFVELTGYDRENP